jgi:hypothetical protein
MFGRAINHTALQKANAKNGGRSILNISAQNPQSPCARSKMNQGLQTQLIWRNLGAKP